MTSHHHVAATAEVTDPVCGMTIDLSDAVGHIDHAGERYYFCSEACMKKFIANPKAYASGANVGSAAPPPVTASARYTCPMHPEVQQDRPGSCPKCGMALESVMPQQ